MAMVRMAWDERQKQSSVGKGSLEKRVRELDTPPSLEEFSGPLIP